MPVRGLLLALFVLFLLPATAQAADLRSSIFFYPWYSNPQHDGAYTHWQQGGREPPDDLASQFFPTRGAYSSTNPRVLRAQMRDIANAGIDEVVSSWWGPGSPEDKRLPDVLKTARAHGLQVATQIEPYPGRSVQSVAADIASFRDLGIRDVYVYRTSDFSAEEWATLTLRLSGVRVFGQTNRVGFAARAGFAGFYTYDILLYGGAKFMRMCEQARALKILCAPSVGPGYAATAATGDVRVKPRRRGATYDLMWRAALRADVDIVTITSYNEWSEGTQIEPAGHGARYETYEGAWGLRGRAAQRAYLDRTAHWTSHLTP